MLWVRPEAYLREQHKMFHLDRLQPWTNFSLQDEPWAEFSTLEVAAACILHLLSGVATQANLELKTQPKQLLGSVPLVITLPAPTLLTNNRLGWKSLPGTNTLAY
jgi:hypothetical protein